MTPRLLLTIFAAAACAGPSSVRPPGEGSRAAPQARAPPDVTAAESYGAEPAVELGYVESAAADAVARRRRGDGPRLSPALVHAAREVAQAAADDDREPLAPRRVRAALTTAGAFDPAPQKVLVSGRVEAIPDRLAERLDPDATHFGVGAAVRGDRAWVVGLAVRRAAVLAPFPRVVAPGAEHVLRGRLLGLRGARVVVTLPSGSTRELPVKGDVEFAAPLLFDAKGRYVLEVVGSGRRGPEVTAILEVDAGRVVPEVVLAPEAEKEPVDLALAEARIEEAVNALRRRHALPALAASPELKRVARRHSADMLAQGVIGHVLPGTGDLAARLRRAGVRFRRATENVAKGPSALVAHEVTADSPAHRGNLLDPAVKQVGIGLARTRLAGGEWQVYLTEIFLDPAAGRE